MHQAPAFLPDLPPIVLMIDDDHDVLDMYSAYFESAGMWVATASAPVDALRAVQELKPDAIVTDAAFQGRPAGIELVHTLKSSEATRAIPLVLLSGHAADAIPAQTRDEADVCLVKPVLPEALLQTVHRLIAASHALRERLERLSTRTAEFLITSERRLSRAEMPADRPEPGVRTCPECARPLDWIEHGRIGGVTYDYYRWCRNGCGLYCYDRDAHHWVKLA